MIVQKVTKLLTETSNTLSIPLPIVQQVVNHQFASLRKHLYNPSPVSTLQLDHIGKFKGSLNATNAQLRRMIPLLRLNPTPQLLANFRHNWSLRQDLIKQKYLSSYKKRFGKWHH